MFQPKHSDQNIPTKHSDQNIPTKTFRPNIPTKTFRPKHSDQNIPECGPVWQQYSNTVGPGAHPCPSQLPPHDRPRRSRVLATPPPPHASTAAPKHSLPVALWLWRDSCSLCTAEANVARGVRAGASATMKAATASRGRWCRVTHLYQHPCSRHYFRLAHASQRASRWQCQLCCRTACTSCSLRHPGRSADTRCVIRGAGGRRVPFMTTASRSHVFGL